MYGEYPEGLELLVRLGDSKIAERVADFEKATPRQLLSEFGKLSASNIRALMEEFEALGVPHIMWKTNNEVKGTDVDFYAFQGATARRLFFEQGFESEDDTKEKIYGVCEALIQVAGYKDASCFDEGHGLASKLRDLEPIRLADAALLNRATLTTSQRNPARRGLLIEAASLELPLDTSTSEDAPVTVRDGESMMCAVSDEIDADSKVVVLQVEISNEGVTVARVSWSDEREGWVRCAHLAKSEALVVLAESSKEDLEEGRKLAVPASPVASQPVFMGKDIKVRNPSTNEKPALPKVPRKGAAVWVVNLWEKEVQVDGEPYPALKDWNYIDFCEEPRSTGNTFARCTERLTYLAQAYLVVRLDHDMKSWGDKPENCELSFDRLKKLTSHGDVKANIAKVRPARSAGGRGLYLYKAETLAVEWSGKSSSSDDDN